MTFCSWTWRKSLLPPHANRTSRRVRFDVADADVPPRDPALPRDAGAFTGQLDLRLARWIFHHLYVRPGDPPAPARPQHLEHRFLRREATGVMLQRSLAA